MLSFADMALQHQWLAAALLAVVVFAASAPSFIGVQPPSNGNAGSRAAGRSDFEKFPSTPEMQLSSEESMTSPSRLGAAFLSMLAAFVVAIIPTEEAQAARSGGRIGGTAPSARRVAPPARAPPTVNRSTTTIINKTVVVPAPAPPVVVAPPVYGGFMAPPIVVAPPPTLGDVVVGAVVGGAINNAIYGGSHRGPTSTDMMLENQQRQDERQLDSQKQEIERLKADLAALKTQQK